MTIDRSLPALLALAFLLLPLREAGASASEWHHAAGGSIRIVTTGEPDAEGLLRGALEIRLKPGWKTYWRDPGESGVPPTLDIVLESGEATVEIGFPTPSRFDDGYSRWAGYDRSVALTLTLRLPEAARTPLRVEASAFLGVCETICIPVQAQLAVPIAHGGDDPEHAAVVASAFAALPGPARPGFEARAADLEGEDAILIEADLPDGASPVDLFVDGTPSLGLGVPKLLDGGAAPVFSVPVTSGGAGAGGREIAYTLVTSAGAVAGTLTLP